MSEKGLRLLWKANAPHVGSGYGVQVNSLLPRLAQLDDVDEIAIFGYFGIQGGRTELSVGRGIPKLKKKLMAHYPIGVDPWGQDVVQQHASHFEADAIITMLDVWVFREDYGDLGFLWLPYSPVDHHPIPPMVAERLKRAFHPLAYSQHASAEYSRVGLVHSLIPLGVETSVFRPMAASTKKKAKRWLDMSSDDFVIGCVAANKGWPSRKGLPELMEAFAILNAKHPDTMLYLHSINKDPVHPGPDLLHLGRLFGISDSLRLTTPYLMTLGFSMQEMALLYQAFDVFCLPSMGEGFGIPLIEAQACGVPVITTQWTATEELCGSGWLVPVGKKFATPLDSFQAFADVPALAEAMEQAYTMWKIQKDAYSKMQTEARLFSLQFDWEVLVRTKWAPLMSWLAAITHKKLFVVDKSQPVQDTPDVGSNGVAPIPLGIVPEVGAPLPLGRTEVADGL